MGSFVGSFVGRSPWVRGAGCWGSTWAGRMWVVSSQFGWFGGLGLGWKQTEVSGGVLGEWSPEQVSIERDEIRVYLYAWAMMCLVIGGRASE